MQAAEEKHTVIIIKEDLIEVRAASTRFEYKDIGVPSAEASGAAWRLARATRELRGASRSVVR